MNEAKEPEFERFIELCAQANSRVRTLIFPAEREKVFQRVLDHILAHPEHRDAHAKAFAFILAQQHRGITSDLVAFCMRRLRWPEVADAARSRMEQDIHNSECASLRELLTVYEPA